MSVKKLKYGLITVNSVPALKDDLDAAKLPSTGLNVEYTNSTAPFSGAVIISDCTAGCKSTMLFMTLRIKANPHSWSTQVELHVHLDGALRLETIWELLKAKNHPLPGRGTLEDLRHTVQVQKPKDLMHFLSGFQYFAPAYV